MSTIGCFEGFQPVALKPDGDDQPSAKDSLPMEEGSSGRDSVPSRMARQPSVTESVLYPNLYTQPHCTRKYFVTRPGAIETARQDLKNHVDETMGEAIQGFWLLTEVDHWNNEKERVVAITDNTLLICKYDFIMLSCVQFQRIPLSSICHICLGKFVFPGASLDKRQGEGIRISWGKSEEQSLLSRWNPWSTEVPYATFIEHPMKNSSEKFSEICKMSAFIAKLVCAVQNAHKSSSRPGRGQEMMVSTEPILIQTYTGLMSFIGNCNKLGYSLARGSIGF
ncbi:tumor protein p63-regulated gene 1 protein [Phascolarctos cinereus]|uniref:Tumor protein p63-regulated gene 1 protein n=1 Tax=Phascolarctos cinereus TaxID=38626 RepID=A0A6P5KJV4_PHACI|nr:tumor protein p63-regulated gene 1 protein [Phascolarctos cinereus]XP_020844710.1 tumor protein p63-regulated gene 1 protein [Phascolarctos cinereus]XP_020844711.1 tumor protein p63-regulated gene 1 protein [Phascolarctos cinereus]